MKYFLTVLLFLLFPKGVVASETHDQEPTIIPVTLSAQAQAVDLSVPSHYTKEDLFNRLGLPSYYYVGDLQQALVPNLEIVLTDLALHTQHVETITTYDTVIVYSPLLFYWEEEITQGSSGKSVHNIIEISYRGDVITQHKVATTVIEPAANTYIVRGLRRQAIDVEATAYSSEQPNLSNYTATGIRAEHGVIAVDPNVIPLGTYVYIPGYGVAIAADTGGRIRGNKIDLAFDTVREAIVFGRQQIRIYVLDQFRDLSR